MLPKRDLGGIEGELGARRSTGLDESFWWLHVAEEGFSMPGLLCVWIGTDVRWKRRKKLERRWQRFPAPNGE